MTWRWTFPKTEETCGGYPLFAIVLVLDGKEKVYKTHLRADTVIKLARSVWKNNQPIDELWVINQKLGTIRDRFYTEGDEE